MREKLIEAIREVPISKTYEEYVEALAERLVFLIEDTRNDRLKISKESVDKIFPRRDIGDIDLSGYKSPIEVMIERVNGQIEYEAENAVYKELRRIGVEVDKNELIKALRYDRGQYEEGYRRGYTAGLNADKWISVEDRLPDPSEYDWVLGAVMTTELPEGFNWYLPPHVVEYRNGEWWAMSEEFSLKDLHCRVTYWMPLPELPNEDAE